MAINFHRGLFYHTAILLDKRSTLGEHARGENVAARRCGNPNLVRYKYSRLERLLYFFIVSMIHDTIYEVKNVTTKTSRYNRVLYLEFHLKLREQLSKVKFQYKICQYTRFKNLI